MDAMTIEQAREYVATLADREGENQFAREVRAGCWDHRNDVQSAFQRGPFIPRKLANAPAREGE
jgi:hypothetical protein